MTYDEMRLNVRETTCDIRAQVRRALSCTATTVTVYAYLTCLSSVVYLVIFLSSQHTDIVSPVRAPGAVVFLLE